MAGQFNPKDLRRVRMLILGQRSYRPPYAVMIHNAVFQDCLSLFPNLEELFFEEWCGAGSGGQLESTDNKPELDSYKETGDEKSAIGDSRELWRCVPCEDMDGIAQVLSCAVGFGRRDLYRLDVAQYSYPRLFGYKGSWYEETQEFLEGRYTQACRPYVKWNTFRVKFVHVFPETMARQFVRGRLAFWHYYMEFKRTYWKGKYVDSLGCVSEPPAFGHMRWWDSDQYRRWFVEGDRDMGYEPDPDGPAADKQYGYLAKYCFPKPRLGII
ncbi:hypothetical protein F5Y04DRAFT_278918 [Hypomontagnella monticulosa]|nr:hypothetical protein F5Y04DRAFT_278918 [Hypomontagnella monticulosa]